MMEWSAGQRLGLTVHPLSALGWGYNRSFRRHKVTTNKPRDGRFQVTIWRRMVTMRRLSLFVVTIFFIKFSIRMNMEPKRLFDAVTYQSQKFPKTDMLISKVDGAWKPYATKDVQQIVN